MSMVETGKGIAWNMARTYYSIISTSVDELAFEPFEIMSDDGHELATIHYNMWNACYTPCICSITILTSLIWNPGKLAPRPHVAVYRSGYETFP